MSSHLDLEELPDAFVTRRSRLWLRVTLAVVVALVLLALTRSTLALIWLATYVTLQLSEAVVLAPNRLATLGASPRLRRTALSLLTLQGIFFGAAPLLSLTDPGGDLGIAMAAVVIVLFASVTQTRGSRSVFLAGLLPQATYLVAVFPTAALLSRVPTDAIPQATAAAVACVAAAVLAWREYSRLLRAAKTAQLAAESATAAKSAFVAMVSHELRTPMTAIQTGASSLLARTGDRLAQDDARLIVDAARMMRSLLDDLLDIAKLESGHMTVESLAFDARQLLRDQVKFWRIEARKKGLRLAIRGGRTLPKWLIGDPVRIRQILNNLLSNALKFTSQGSVRICVSRPDGGMLRLAVDDTGPGLSAAQLERLFKPFSQADDTVARRHGGTGLGLSISRQLALLMGGDLTVSSRPGFGSSFRLDLPERLGSAPAEMRSFESEVSASAFKILAVDDHEVNRRAIQLLLQPLSADLILAADGQEALEIMARDAFDVVLLDVHMPDLGGVEVAGRIRTSNGLNRGVPIIAISGDSEAEARAGYAAVGMNACVAKPIEPGELYAAIERVLSEHRPEEDGAPGAATG